jgi:hypothetical protein
VMPAPITITCCVTLINKKYHARARRWNFPDPLTPFLSVR